MAYRRLHDYRYKKHMQLMLCTLVLFIDRCGPSNEMRSQLQPKKKQGKAVLAINIAAKDILPVLHC